MNFLKFILNQQTCHVKTWRKHWEETKVCNNDDLTWHAMKWNDMDWLDMKWQDVKSSHMIPFRWPSLKHSLMFTKIIKTTCDLFWPLVLHILGFDLWSLDKSWFNFKIQSKYAIKMFCPSQKKHVTFSALLFQRVEPLKLKITSNGVLALRCLCAKFKESRLKAIKNRACTGRRTDKQTNRISTMNRSVSVIKVF